MIIKPKSEPTPHNQGRRAQHRTVKATVFLKESVATARHEKTESAGAKLGGPVPGALRTLPLKSERGPMVLRVPSAPQAPSGCVDLAAASGALVALDHEICRQLAYEARVSTRARPLGAVVVDTLTAWRGALCRFGRTDLIDDRFAVCLMPLQAVVGFVRQHTCEEGDELADAAGLLHDAAAAGLVPAIVCVGGTLVVSDGRWPVPRLGGPK